MKFPHVAEKKQNVPAHEHEKSGTFFESHQDIYEQYAGHSITVAPAPEGLDTFAFDLNSNVIYLNDTFYENLGYPEKGTSFAVFHEIEHFREKIALLKERDGIAVFNRFLLSMDPRVSPHAQAYALMDNCISDIRQNAAVVQRTHTGFTDVEKNLYSDIQFPDVDFTNQPLHIQLPYALLNEYRTGRICVVDERVRKIIDELKSIPSTDGKTRDCIAVMTNPDPNVAPMSVRLRLQDKYIWPKVLELLEDDVESDKRKKQSNKKTEDKSKQQGKSEEESDSESETPNDRFKKSYEEAKKRVPNGVSVEQQEQAAKKWEEENGDPEKMKDATLAEKLGFKTEDVTAYKEIVRSFHEKNRETDESIVDQLEDIIKRIISSRLKERATPRYPMDEGDELIDPAGWVTETRQGNSEPQVWEDSEILLKKDVKFGEVEITLVCDRSKSMSEQGGLKQKEQQKTLVLFMEALKRFNDLLEDDQAVLEKPLVLKSEIYTFQGDEQDVVPIKKMGKNLSEQERISCFVQVHTTPGSTTDFRTLEAIVQGIQDETLEKIKEGELRKIVIILTDGESANPDRVQEMAKLLRNNGVILVGIGITQSGATTLTTYAPKAVIAEKAENLPFILKDTLQDVLSGV